MGIKQMSLGWVLLLGVGCATPALREDPLQGRAAPTVEPGEEQRSQVRMPEGVEAVQASGPVVEPGLLSPGLDVGPMSMPQSACLESTFGGSPEIVHRRSVAPPQCQRGLEVQW